MIICPNCNHANPDGAKNCEACYTDLPVTIACPNCGAAVQPEATFCGQCGFNLQIGSNPSVTGAIPETQVSSVASSPAQTPDPAIPVVLPTIHSIPNIQEEATAGTPALEIETSEKNLTPPVGEVSMYSTQPDGEIPVITAPISPPIATPTPSVPPIPSVVPTPLAVPTPPAVLVAPPIAQTGSGATQLQSLSASLFHIQTNTKIEIPHNLAVIHIGKPNNQVPPDVDVSGFPNSEIVSRIHADIRVDGDGYYIEDLGSSNGTYVNHVPLLQGNRHLLRPGDRIALGKGDKVTFIFQLG
jgi:ribosomal protein L40E